VNLERKKALQVGRKVGALFGAIMFVVFGIVPGFYFGSYAPIVLVSHLIGGPVEAGIIMRGLVVVGIILGLFCTAAVSIVIGSVAGTALAFIADAFTEAVSAKPKAETETSEVQ